MVSTTTIKTHRACDECRSRKLKCIKQGETCVRCRQEGLACHFSEQKPMGRPRKRPHLDDTSDAANDAASRAPEHPEPFIPLDPDLDHLIMESAFAAANLGSGHIQSHTAQTKGNTFNFFSNIFEPPPQPDVEVASPSDSSEQSQDQPPKSTPPGADRRSETQKHTSQPRSTIPLFANIFEPPPEATAAETALPRDSTDESMDQSNPTPPTEPGVSHPYVHGFGEPSASQCSCLASVYLALAALQSLPREIAPALSTVREAGATASKVLNCPVCGQCPVEADCTPPIANFQNSMLLGTMVPTIADAYKKVLAMVDCETNTAQALGQKKVFSLAAYGGLHQLNDTPGCSTSHLDHVELDPVQWRTTVRAMLRADIYGYPHGCYQGIRSIIDEMEKRSRTRHAALDDMAAQGLLSERTLMYCVGEKDRACMKIINAARAAMDSVVIT